MTVNLNIRARAVEAQTADNASLLAPEATADPFVDPQSAVSEMAILFSGTRHLDPLRAEHPLPSLNIPGFERDILSSAPLLGDSSRTVGAVINHYQLLRRNLIDRRNNYAHAMEGYLGPDEAFDISNRIDLLDRALLKTDQELEKAIRRKRELKAVERGGG